MRWRVRKYIDGTVEIWRMWDAQREIGAMVAPVDGGCALTLYEYDYTSNTSVAVKDAEWADEELWQKAQAAAAEILLGS